MMLSVMKEELKYKLAQHSDIVSFTVYRIHVISQICCINLLTSYCSVKMGNSDIRSTYAKLAY